MEYVTCKRACSIWTCSPAREPAVYGQVCLQESLQYMDRFACKRACSIRTGSPAREPAVYGQVRKLVIDGDSATCLLKQPNFFH